jgi:thiol-disulfide isomerase/thioredoxin/tetratricopeptide (TPR) repeat protein
MKNNRLERMSNLMALALMLGLGHATAATMSVGDPAPKLQVSKWVQGEPVKDFQRDKAYLVEFWATWCGPCLESIPHVNDLHTKFKDKGLIVIGQDVLEQDPDKVPPFVKKMGDKMTYRVALDTEDGKMAQTWMDAAGEDGIPTAFVVDKHGTIVWIGHPVRLQESFLQQVVDGTLDVSKTIAEHDERKQREAQRAALWREFSRHQQKEEWERAESVLAEIEKLLPEAEREGVDLTRFGFLLNRKSYQAAYKIAARISEAHPDDAMMQNSLAWTIATKEGLAERDLPLAEKIARRAKAAAKSDFEKAEIFDTLARVLFLKGERKPAIELQEQAVQFATGGRKDQFQNNLEDYRAGRVPNEARLRSLVGEIGRSIGNREWSKAESALAELEKASPQGDRIQFDSYRFSILAGRGDYEGATKIADRLAQAPAEKAMMLNSLAWGIAIRESATARDLELAEKIIRRADETTKGGNAEILDTLARVLFLRGQKAPAIELQEKAVSVARGRRKAQFQETLDSYKNDVLPKAY